MDEALQAYTGKGVADIESANSADSVEAATFNDTLYAFPMTADNGYFLYYDSTVLSEEDVASWDTMLAKADEAGKKVAMTLASGWYNASFFYSAGFTTGLNDDGSTSMDWNGEADYTGVEVTQAMLNITGSPAFMAVADGDSSNQIASGQLCARYPAHGMQRRLRKHSETAMLRQNFRHLQLQATSYSRNPYPDTSW